MLWCSLVRVRGPGGLNLGDQTPLSAVASLVQAQSSY